MWPFKKKLTKPLRSAHQAKINSGEIDNKVLIELQDIDSLVGETSKFGGREVKYFTSGDSKVDGVVETKLTELGYKFRYVNPSECSIKEMIIEW